MRLVAGFTAMNCGRRSTGMTRVVPAASSSTRTAFAASSTTYTRLVTGFTATSTLGTGGKVDWDNAANGMRVSAAAQAPKASTERISEAKRMSDSYWNPDIL